MTEPKDHFERLGLLRRFSVDLPLVEANYLERSRSVHPDFHALGTEAEQRESLEQTAALNEAYLALKDPFRRAEYLLRIYGGPTGQQQKNLDQAFLMEMMDYRERIEESRPSGLGEREIESELNGRLDEIRQTIAEHFRQLEFGPDDARHPHLVAIRGSLNAAKTLQSLLRDLREV